MIRLKDFFPFLARLALAGVFAYAGLLKLRGPMQFAEAVEAYSLLHPLLISLVAVGLPVLELLTAVALVLNRPRRLGLLSAVMMSAMFVIALSSAAARGLDIECGCFGSDGILATGSTWTALGRAIVLLGIAVALYLRELRLAGRSEASAA
jgi:uncharacterized membrane protein YphA (DoxX/SURF4 family)